jgi:hypothetical protein
VTKTEDGKWEIGFSTLTYEKTYTCLVCGAEISRRFKVTHELWHESNVEAEEV